MDKPLTRNRHRLGGIQKEDFSSYCSMQIKLMKAYFTHQPIMARGFYGSAKEVERRVGDLWMHNDLNKAYHRAFRIAKNQGQDIEDENNLYRLTLKVKRWRDKHQERYEAWEERHRPNYARAA